MIKYSISQAQKALDDDGATRCAVYHLCKNFDGITNADTACGTHDKCLKDGAHDESKSFRSPSTAPTSQQRARAQPREPEAEARAAARGPKPSVPRL